MSPLRRALLVLLVLSAAAALLVQPRVVAAVRTDTLDVAWLVVAPAIFALVVVLAALDTWRTARRTGFFRGPSVLLIALCVAFLGLLLPSTFSEYRARTSPPAEPARLMALLKHKDPRVRALVMDAVGWRPGPPEDAAPLLAVGLDDKDPLVSEAAVHAVANKAGEPLAGAQGLERARALVTGWTR
jgi:hypothetical protein